MSQVCDNHSGLEIKIDGIKETVDKNEVKNAEDHKEIWTAINDLRNRLPLWATFLIGGMGTAIGYLMAMAKLVK